MANFCHEPCLMKETLTNALQNRAGVMNLNLQLAVSPWMNKICTQ